MSHLNLPFLSSFLQCNHTCGVEQETRSVYCANAKGKIYAEDVCHDYRRPEAVRECTDKNICEFAWFAMQWSEVSQKSNALWKSFIKAP